MMCLSSIVEIILKFESISNPLNGQQQNTFKHSASSWKNFQFDGFSFRFLHFCYKKSQITMTMLMMQIVLTMRRKKYPLLFLSKTLKASLMSSSRSVSLSFLAIIERNSSKSISPLPSLSTCLKIIISIVRPEKRKQFVTSLIISLSSATVGFCPRLFITVPSSFVLIVPDFIIDYKSC